MTNEQRLTLEEITTEMKDLIERLAPKDKAIIKKFIKTVEEVNYGIKRDAMELDRMYALIRYSPYDD